MLDNCEPFITHEIRSAIIQHMKAEAPKECCGLITLTRGKYNYEPKDNVHADPEHFFSFDKENKVAIQRRKSVVAYVHSHPTGPSVPSQRDVEVQLSVKKPSLIGYCDPTTGVVDLFSFGDHLLEAPLDGRIFRYNQFDCVFALRSWVWQNEKRYMPPPPTSSDGWWVIGAQEPDKLSENPDLYTKNFKNYGYEEFTPDLGNPSSEWHPKTGDVMLMQLAAPVINHAAVYTGNNLLYHHRAGKLSGPQAAGYLLPSTRKWVRYHE